GIFTITYADSYQGYTNAEAIKLAGVATGATANETDAFLVARANHTGEQAMETITGLNAALATFQPLDMKGQANGYASLDENGKVPISQMDESI
ncbi:UNVERIFIED_CONTAM: hypothetical protein NY100_18090, partial [Prevotella sp. 15_C9]